MRCSQALSDKVVAMLGISTRLIALACVILVGFHPGRSNSSAAVSRTPAATITLSVSEKSRSEFVRQLKAFADNEKFEIRTASLQAHPEHVYAELWRDDASMIVSNFLNIPTEFSVFVYIESNARSPADIASIVKSLKDMIVKIPGVTITMIK
jgi:hypothetical protein